MSTPDFEAMSCGCSAWGPEGSAVDAPAAQTAEAVDPEERPRLVSRPMPAGWTVCDRGYAHGSGAAVFATSHDYHSRSRLRERAIATLALLDWLDEDAVRAQEVTP